MRKLLALSLLSLAAFALLGAQSGVVGKSGIAGRGGLAGGASNFTPIAHCVAVNTGTCTIDTTGANLIVVGAVAGGLNAPTAPTENKGNTFQAPAAASWSLTGNNSGQIYYIFSPTVGSNHIFTGGSAQNIYFVSAWSGALAGSGVFDTGNANSQIGSLSTLNVGSVTPATTNELMVSMVINSDNALAWTVPTSFTSMDTSTSYGIEQSAYFVDPSTSAINPQWSSAGTPTCGGAVAVFKHQ